MERIVHKIELNGPQIPMRKNAAAYVRVSDGKDAMLHSLAAQVSYYNALIGRHPEWRFAGIYADADKPYGLIPKARECKIMTAFTGISF